MEKSILKNFIKYVSLNIMGMIGLSCYILADTFFVAKALGATGIAALNFSISIYSVIHGTGLMIGIGGATRYSILKSRNKDMKANIIFTTCMKLGVVIGIIFALIGILGTTPLALVLGADMTTLPLTKEYLSTILCFAPFFIINNIVLAFVRNDNNPNLSMIAMLLGSFSNIVLDYVFMFPFGMGMFGAAFATGLAPIISIGVLLIHFIKKKNNFKYIHSKVKFSYIRDIFGLGLSTFIVEVSSAVVLITFNLVILRLRGNLGVAAYGIVANIALVGISVFTGIAQGVQPLISKGYGLKNYELLGKVKNYALITSVSLALFMYLFMFLNSDSIIGIFNSEKNLEIAQIAKSGLRIYFIGFFFVGINIIMAMYLSATERTRDAFIISVSRGCVIILPLVILLSRIWNITGVWFAFVLTECIVTVIAFYMVKLKRNL
ncbi:MATE family efflux transporter [Clostridium intestinale]|uniref:Multidrug export protein MepA n=1 Tax=Clostridium intestinale TaxID=36845 RepID=A0A7D6VSL9_9CLOT|nr:MATE family efflux transporter [Clostridium intestinale]QLY81856.1 MATE family efflux transporter [Clostridium intestinale]